MLTTLMLSADNFDVLRCSVAYELLDHDEKEETQKNNLSRI